MKRRARERFSVSAVCCAKAHIRFMDASDNEPEVPDYGAFTSDTPETYTDPGADETPITLPEGDPFAALDWCPGPPACGCETCEHEFSLAVDLGTPGTCAVDGHVLTDDMHHDGRTSDQKEDER